MCSSDLNKKLKEKAKEEFDKKSVLERFNHQLQTSGINTKHTLLPDFSWSCADISKIKSEYKLEKYIVIFPFCSPHLTQKKWPYYNELIEKRKAPQFGICSDRRHT